MSNFQIFVFVGNFSLFFTNIINYINYDINIPTSNFRLFCHILQTLANRLKKESFKIDAFMKKLQHDNEMCLCNFFDVF